MKKIKIIISFISLILMILSTYISNYYALMFCTGFAILAFITNEHLSFGLVVSYILTLSTIVFKLSMVYKFDYSINLSASYIYLSMAISTIIGFILLGYNLVSLKR